MLRWAMDRLAKEKRWAAANEPGKSKSEENFWVP